MIKKVQNTVPWTYAMNDLNGEEVIETYEKGIMKKKCKKQIKKNLG